MLRDLIIALRNLQFLIVQLVAPTYQKAVSPIRFKDPFPRPIEGKSLFRSGM